MAAAPVLKVLRDGQAIREEEVYGEIDLGRAEGCVIRLDDRAISRRHAVIRPVDGGIEIEKKSEFAPLSVNGAECARAVVKEGDVVNIGPYLMRVAIPKPEPAPAPAPAAAAPAAPAAPQTDAPTAILPEAEALEMPSESRLNEVPAEAEAPAPVEEPAPEENPEGEAAPDDPFASADGAPAEGESGDMGLAGLGDPPAEGDGMPNLDFGGMGDPLGEPPADPAETGPDMSTFDSDDGATRLTPAAKVTVRLLIPEGRANVTEFEVTKDEVIIGRGKGCDIILDDKKSSRKNTLIRRAGLSFIVKDLESANGTLVNGVRVQEQELSGDDVIRVGDTEITFKATSVEYEEAQGAFASVTDEPPEGAEADAGMAFGDAGGGFDGGIDFGAGAMAPVDPATGLPAEQGQAPLGGFDPAQAAAMGGLAGMGVPGVGAPEPPKSGIAALKHKWSSMPKEQRKKLLVYLVVGVFVYDMMFPEEPPVQKAPPPKKPAAAAQGQGAAPGKRTFEMLSPEQRKFVDSQHSLAFDLYRNKEYDKALFEIQKIFQLVDDYKNSREIERYANDGKRKMEQIEEEKRRKEEEARLKAKIAELVDEAGKLMAQKAYDQAEPVFGQILAIDPENQMVSTWQREIERVREEERRKLQEKEVQEKINANAREIYQDGLHAREKGRLKEAIAIFEKVPGSGASDAQLLRDAKDRIEEIRADIRSQLDPVLAEAAQAEESGQHSEAYQLFEKAAGIDPDDPRGREGMDRIRGLLNENAKKIYVEGIVAESYSDFKMAREKFEEVTRIAPKDSVYHERAKRKLTQYNLLKGGGGE